MVLHATPENPIGDRRVSAEAAHAKRDRHGDCFNNAQAVINAGNALNDFSASMMGEGAAPS